MRKAKVIATGETISVVKDWENYGGVVFVGYADSEGNTYQESDLELLPEESPESATIEGWVARDACDALYLHQSKPELSSGIGFWYDGYDKRSLPEDIFPEITFKNSPRKVRITITPIEDE